MTAFSPTTAPAATSGTASSPQRTVGRPKRKVKHYFWAKDMTFSRDTGISIPSLCGVWKFTGRGPINVMNDGNGRMIRDVETTDCKRCVRSLKAACSRWRHEATS